MFEKDPRTFSPEYKKLSPEQKAMVKLEITITKFFKDFDRSISRWERLIYPVVIVFGLLGLSGFYLIYNMTKDMQTISTNMDPHMQTNLSKMSENMAELTQNITVMTGYLGVIVEKIESMDSHVNNMDTHVRNMSVNINDMRASIADVDTHITSMDTAIVDMNRAIQGMTYNTGVMSRDMNIMNRNISRPASFFNNIAPW